MNWTLLGISSARTAFLVCSICTLLISPLWSDEHKHETIESVLQGYQSLVDEAHILEAHIKLQMMTMQKEMVTETHKPLFESLYSIPIEDPIYQTVPLFFQSTSLVEWDLILNGVKMTVAEEMKSSDTYLSEQDFRTVDTFAYTRRLQMPQQDLMIDRFSLQAENIEAPSSNWPILFPEEITDWTYLPNAWYPRTSRLFIPEDASEITHRGGNGQSHTLQYTPAGMPESFLIFLQYLSGNTSLSVDDLLCITEFADGTNTLQTFGIAIHDGRHRYHLFNINNVHGGKMIGNLPYPNSTNVSISALVPVNEENQWRMHFMSNMQVTMMEALN